MGEAANSLTPHCWGRVNDSQRGESSIRVCHYAILLPKAPSSSLTSKFAHISQSLPWAHVAMGGLGLRLGAVMLNFMR